VNNALIISWLIFIATLLALLGFDYMKEDQSRISHKIVLSRKTIQTLRENAGSTFIGYYPESRVSTLKQKLLWAGEPWELTAQDYIGIQFSLLILGIIIGINLMIIQFPLVISLTISILLFFSPNLLLNEKIKKRKGEIEKDIPNMVGLLSTSLKAGVELIPSLQSISMNLPGALGDELRIVWTENATGKQFTQSLRDMATRTGVDILKSFVDTIITAQERGGVNLSENLSDFSTTVLEYQRRKAQEAAKKVPTKMLAPMFLCIFTSMLALLLAPVVFTLTSALQ
jgi:Flp pilus assembly protein TadB